MPVRMAPLASCSSRTSFCVKVMAGWPSPSLHAHQQVNSRSAFSPRTRAIMVLHPSPAVDHAGQVKLGQGVQDARAAQAHGRRVADGLVLDSIAHDAHVLDGAVRRRACRA